MELEYYNRDGVKRRDKEGSYDFFAELLGTERWALDMTRIREGDTPVYTAKHSDRGVYHADHSCHQLGDAWMIRVYPLWFTHNSYYLDPCSYCTLSEDAHEQVDD